MVYETIHVTPETITADYCLMLLIGLIIHFNAACMLNYNHIAGQNHLNILNKSMCTLIRHLKSFNNYLTSDRDSNMLN